MKANLRKKALINFLICASFTAFIFVILCSTSIHAAEVSIDLNSGTTGDNMGALDILFLFGLIALLPSIVLTMTSFTRLIIVFSFLRNALGTQQSPPNQVLIGLSLILTMFIMSNTINQINQEAYIPYKNKEITQEVAIQRATDPMKEFMLKQVDKESMSLFIDISKTKISQEIIDEGNEGLKKLSLTVIIPAFITSELKRAFLIGFLLFIPFLIIDIVVSSVLMSMGMVMLPPSMISLPFKILVFVLVDGWGLLIRALVIDFR